MDKSAVFLGISLFVANVVGAVVYWPEPLSAINLFVAGVIAYQLFDA